MESFSSQSMPQQIAEQCAAEWNWSDPDAVRVELPFRIRSENPDVQHVLLNEEYLVVRSEEPYGPENLWPAGLDFYRLEELATNNNVSVYSVPEGLVTLAALMNDAVAGNGDPEIIYGVFEEMGKMMRRVRDAAGGSINPSLHLADVAVIKGREEPLILPPFNLLSDDKGGPVVTLQEELCVASQTDHERTIVQIALESFEREYNVVA